MAQTPMYTQVVGKQATTLSTQFTPGQTEMNVASTSFLPAAPNYVTVQTQDGSRLATFLYTAKLSATKLTVSSSATESLGGTGAYPAGSVVARPLCKVDVDALQSNITDHEGRLATAQTNISTLQSTKVDGVTIGANTTHFAECTTPASTVAKIASIPGFALNAGARAVIRFVEGDSSTTVSGGARAQPTLNISSTGAKNITYRGANASEYLYRGAIYELVYTGTTYEIVGDVTNRVNPRVHGILIDDANSDPNDRVKIVGASADWTRAQREAEFAKYCRHCVFKAGRTAYYVDETDWSKKEDGTSSGLTDGFALDGNFGVEYSQIWWRVSHISNDVHLIEFTWENPHDDSWTTPHMFNGRLCKHLYVGTFEASLGAGRLRSVYTTSQACAMNITLQNFRSYAQANGPAEGLTGENTYELDLPLTMAMRHILAIWVYRTTNFRNDVALGYTTATSSMTAYSPGNLIAYTGNSLNTQGSTTDGLQPCVINGIANEYGNIYKVIDGMIYDGKDMLACATEGGDLLNIWDITTPEQFDRDLPANWVYINNVCHTHGYIKNCCFHPVYPFACSEVGASTSTYYGGYNYRTRPSSAPDATYPRIPRGVWSAASREGGGITGLFFVRISSGVGRADGVMGARLSAHSTD